VPTQTHVCEAQACVGRGVHNTPGMLRTHVAPRPAVRAHTPPGTHRVYVRASDDLQRYDLPVSCIHCLEACGTCAIPQEAFLQHTKLCHNAALVPYSKLGVKYGQDRGVQRRWSQLRPPAPVNKQPAQRLTAKTRLLHAAGRMRREYHVVDTCCVRCAGSNAAAVLRARAFPGRRPRCVHTEQKGPVQVQAGRY